MNVDQLRENQVLRADVADVGAAREHSRRRRLSRLLLPIGAIGAWLWASVFLGHLVGTPRLTHSEAQALPLIGILILVAAVMVVPLLAAGRSPHVRYRPEEIDVSLDDVKGMPVVVEEAVRTLNLFLAHSTFRTEMGGTPRKGILFEGPPGTGKTHLAKALAREAGVPFFFVSSSAFQSMFYGQTNRKIRSFFVDAAQGRPPGGRRHRLHRGDRRHRRHPGRHGHGRRPGGHRRCGQRVAHPAAVLRPATRGGSAGGVASSRWSTGCCPPTGRSTSRTWPPANVLVIGATNRASDLDPALLRPGRFDRTITFDLPSRSGRKQILDHELTRRSHEPEVAERTDRLAAQTFGYSPAMLVHVLDEALVWALRRGAVEMSWEDVQNAKLTEEIGLAQPVEYTEAERRTIATHESGHATVAWLVGKSRRLEVLSIVKRSAALGIAGPFRYRGALHPDRVASCARWSRSRSAGWSPSRSSSVSAARVSPATSSTPPTWPPRWSAAWAWATRCSPTRRCRPGASNLTAKVLSSDEGREAVARLLAGARDEVTTLLEANRHVVEALRDALLERDELVGDEIGEVIRGSVEQQPA